MGNTGHQTYVKAALWEIHTLWYVAEKMCIGGGKGNVYFFSVKKKEKRPGIQLRGVGWGMAPASCSEADGGRAGHSARQPAASRCVPGYLPDLGAETITSVSAPKPHKVGSFWIGCLCAETWVGGSLLESRSSVFVSVWWTFGFQS